MRKFSLLQHVSIIILKPDRWTMGGRRHFAWVFNLMETNIYITLKRDLHDCMPLLASYYISVEGIEHEAIVNSDHNCLY